MKRAAEFRLASALACYPSDESAGRVLRAATEAGALDGFKPPTGATLALAAAGAVELGELEAEYVDLFDRGVAENPLHGTGYSRDRYHEPEERFAGVIGLYRTFGLEPRSRERLDHVAVELEFYGWLLRKSEHLEQIGDLEGAGIMIDARRKLLGEHLAPLTAAIASRPAIRASTAYGPVFSWIASLVAGETNRLGIAFEPLELSPARSEPRSRTESDALAGAPAPAETMPAEARLAVLVEA